MIQTIHRRRHFPQRRPAWSFPCSCSLTLPRWGILPSALPLKSPVLVAGSLSFWHSLSKDQSTLFLAITAIQLPLGALTELVCALNTMFLTFLANEGLILKASRSSHTQRESGSIPANIFFQVPQGSSGIFTSLQYRKSSNPPSKDLAGRPWLRITYAWKYSRI